MPLVDILIDTQAELQELVIASGLRVLEVMLKEDRAAAVPPYRRATLGAVRADMDALPVTEETDVPFRSTRRTTYLGQEVGVMHACGHDVHTAVQLGVAAILKARQHDLPGTVMFLFQPAEEGPPPGEEGGAALMLAEGVFSDLRPDAVFGLHASAQLAVGRAAYTPGGALAAVDHFRVTIRGRQSHGAAPHLAARGRRTDS